MPRNKVGVVLFQLGGPDSLEAIEPFLFNLFSDPDIIDFPLAKLARQPLARLISSRRSKHVAHHYEAIGGKSPIADFTSQQAKALEGSLSSDMDVRVVVAMRYWRPFTQEAAAEMTAFSPDQLVLLPLYPQYSKTTTGSALKEWRRVYQPSVRHQKVHVIPQFHEDSAYIDAVTAAVDQSLSGFDNPAEVDVVFSAHSVPVEVIKSGDPYQRHIERTVDLVWQRGGWPSRRHLCYQSKVGPSKWLRPMMRETLESLGKRRAQHVLMVPISFVSDHVETLFEINIEHREIAEHAGISDFRMVPGLNDSPSFIRALADLVRNCVMTAPSDSLRKITANV
jgi:protoporphyrin/coproporphyrin ferrochelatase